MMVVNFKFDIGQVVEIVELKIFGRVRGVNYIGKFNKYLVTYFYDGVNHEDWLYEDNLK